MSRLGGIALLTLLLVAGLAIPGQSQESGAEEQRWPYFEAEHLLLPPSGAREFGHDVDTDGERILVAARSAAYLYGRDNAGWSLTGTYTPPSGDPVQAVSLGNGHVAVATETETTLWRLKDGVQTILKGDQGFGEDVLLREGFLFVSRPSSISLSLNDRGDVTVYRFQNGMYSRSQTITEPSSDRRVFGADLDVQDGSLVVGAPASPLVEQAAPGAAYFYLLQGTTWSLDGSAIATRGGDAQSSFGYKVATTGDTMVVSASLSYLGSSGDRSSGWVSFFERQDGAWRKVQEESTDATAVAAREDTVLLVDWWWNNVAVYLHSSEHLDCSWGPWCHVGYLGGWASFYGDKPYPEALTMEGRVAALGAPSEWIDDQRSGAVLAYYDNALPRAVGLPDEPVDDLDADGRETVTLDGSHSFDPDGQIVSYTWRQNGRTLTETPFVDVELPLGLHEFELEVMDDLGGVDVDHVQVEVRTPRLELDIQFCCERYNGGVDPDRTVYFWSNVRDHRAGVKHWDWDFDGDGVVDSTEYAPHHRFPYGGTWPVALTVTNEAGDRMTTSRDVEVRNAPPTAHAGRPQVVSVDPLTGTGTATLDASLSTDPDGEIQGYDWLRRDPVAGSYSTAAEGETADVTVTRGVNEFLLWVRDDDGARSQGHTTIIGKASAGGAGNETGPSLHVTFSAEQVTGRSVRVEETSNADNAEVVAWIWGRNEEEQQIGGRQHVLAYEDAGLQDVYLTAYDADGNLYQRSTTIQLTDGAPEVYLWPDAGFVPLGTHVTLMTHVEDEAPQRLQWRWQMEDATSDHQDVGHTFDRLGNQTITVAVTDDMGHTTQARGWIHVLAPEEFQSRFSEELADPEATLDGVGVFEDPDEEIQEDLERQRRLQDDADGKETEDGDDGQDDKPGPLQSATVPAPPGPRSTKAIVWALASLGAAALALVALEARRQRKRVLQRRKRYEAAFRARLARGPSQPQRPRQGPPR